MQPQSWVWCACNRRNKKARAGKVPARAIQIS